MSWCWHKWKTVVVDEAWGWNWVKRCVKCGEIYKEYEEVQEVR